MAIQEAEADAVSFAFNSYATALCLIPPESCWPSVDRLRSLYDKAYRKWPPHVNLIYPFVQPDSLDAASRRIQSLLRQNTAHSPVDVCLDTPGVFNQRHEKTLFLHDGREDGSVESLCQLHSAIVAILLGGRAADNEGGSSKFRMHMTVAQSSGAGTAPAEMDADIADARPNDTRGHAHQFLLHKVANMPPVLWQADRLHIVERERLAVTGASDGGGSDKTVRTSSRMRLWGVLHLLDGRIDRFHPPETFYDVLPFDNDEQDGETEAEDGRGQASNDLPTSEAVTFVPEEDEWIRCSDGHMLYTPLPPIEPDESLSVATYNVLGEFEWPPSQDRVPLLIDNILATNAAADVLALQEVTDHVLSALLADDRVRRTYPFASHGPPDQPDMEPLPSLLNTVVLSRRPFSWSWLDFHRAHKGALIARFDPDGHDDPDVTDGSDYAGYDVCDPRSRYGLVLATVHLTHGLTNGSVSIKRTELRQLLSHLQQHYPPRVSDAVVLAGDLNIHSSAFAIEAAVRRKSISSQTAHFVEDGFDDLFKQYGFVDAYHATRNCEFARDDETEETKHAERLDHSDILLHDGEEGATYNPFTNALAARIIGSGLNTRPERFDRILVLDPAGTDRDSHASDDNCRDSDLGRYAVTHYNMFGFPATNKDHSVPESYGSDHWGVRCTLTPIDHGHEADDLDSSTPAEAASMTRRGDEKVAVSAEVEKLVVPVRPTLAPPGPLADGEAVHAALEALHVLPSEDDVVHRKKAFERLRSIILDSKADQAPSTTANDPRELVVVPVGSYGLGVWTPASDIDCLCIGTFGAMTFFALASQRLRAAAAASDGSDPCAAVRIVRRVRAHTGTMLELELGGVRIDLQYCCATVVAETWPSVLVLPPTHPIFALSPQTLAKLKAARDLFYLRRSFPDRSDSALETSSGTVCTAKHFQAAHRAIKTWARARGLYAARFGYLGGIQIAVLLARVMKLMQRELEAAASTDKGAGGRAASDYTVADTLVTFFQHYADFDWATKVAFDPFFHSQRAPYARSAREPLAIVGYHRPQLNTSMAASVPSVRVLAEEFRRAGRLLSEKQGGLTWARFLSGGGDERSGVGSNSSSNNSSSSIVPEMPTSGLISLPPGAAEFVRAYRSYVKLDLQYWGLSLSRGAAFVGWLESRCVMLLVDLARRLPGLNARIWPGRFVEVEAGTDGESSGGGDGDGNGEADRQYQGCYLIGLDLPPTMAHEDRRLALGTLQSVLAHFEKHIRRGSDGDANLRNFDPQWQWIGIGIINQSRLGDVARLRLDSRAWGAANEEEEADDDDDDGDDDAIGDEDDGSGAERAAGRSFDDDVKRAKRKAARKSEKRLPMAVTHRPSSGKFRTAQDVIKRLRWDPHLDRSDFIVGYEDRFLGARERPLEEWKSEQTDEEFIPQHRILYFRRRSDSVVVWDRRTRKDDIFGSGV